MRGEHRGCDRRASGCECDCVRAREHVPILMRASARGCEHGREYEHEHGL